MPSIDEFRKRKDNDDEFYIIGADNSFDEHPDFDEYTIGDYFQRMPITRAEKTERVETAKKVKKKVGDFFLFQWDDLRKGWFLTLTSSEDYRNMLFDLYMTFSSLKDDYMNSLARRWANEVENYTEKVITSSPDYPKFQAVYWNQVVRGQRTAPITKAETSEDILNVLSDKRAERISLNETNVIKNYERHLDLVSGGQYTHTWQTMEDEKVRPSHVIADGQTVPINEPFHVNGQYLMFPGDTSLGASGDTVINCRCYEL